MGEVGGRLTLLCSHLSHPDSPSLLSATSLLRSSMKETLFKNYFFHSPTKTIYYIVYRRTDKQIDRQANIETGRKTDVEGDRRPGRHV